MDSRGAKELMDHIIRYSIREYLEIVRKRQRGRRYSRKRLKELIEFFGSDWFYALSWGVDGNWVIDQMNKCAGVGTQTIPPLKPHRPIYENEQRQIITMRESGATWGDIGKALDRHPITCRNAYTRYYERIKNNEQMGSERKAVAVIDN